jgi:hypothetical protein
MTSRFDVVLDVTTISVLSNLSPVIIAVAVWIGISVMIAPGSGFNFISIVPGDDDDDDDDDDDENDDDDDDDDENVVIVVAEGSGGTCKTISVEVVWTTSMGAVSEGRSLLGWGCWTTSLFV